MIMMTHDMIQWVIKTFKQHESLLYRYKNNICIIWLMSFKIRMVRNKEILNLLTEDIDANLIYLLL